MQSTGVLNLSIGLTGVKENHGAHLSYKCLAHAALLCFSFPSSCRRAPARLRSRQRRSPAAARPPCSHRFAPSLHAPRATRHTRRRPRAPPPERLCAATIATPRRCRVLSRRSRTPCRPRSRASTPFTPQPQPISARQVFDSLSDRDGSREEEGKGGRCGEARPQADSRRERGREGRDGGQGRRGAGVRSCSPVRDQGSASQGQGQRPRYGPSQRCQGHQSPD